MTSATTNQLLPAQSRRQTKSRGQLALIWRRFQRDRAAVIGALIVLAVIFCAIFAPFLAPADPLKQDAAGRLQPIGAPDHLLGTDSNGRDVLSRLIYGSRVALQVALIPVIFSGVIGLALGLMAGYYGGWLDAVTMRLADVMFAFPAILLAIAIVAALGPSQLNAIFALTVVFIPAGAISARTGFCHGSAGHGGLGSGHYFPTHSDQHPAGLHCLCHLADRPDDYLCCGPEFSGAGCPAADS
jgi:peptide/nickel transport system permease protein